MERSIEDWCNYYNINSYTIIDNIINVARNVYISNINSEKIPVQFGIVNGSFNCSYNKLISLNGCPKEVGGYFDCSNNELSSLEGCPEKVRYKFYCHSNNLTTLKYHPKIIDDDFIPLDDEEINYFLVI